MSGYARLHRDLIGHPAFRNDAEAMAFAWMILRASWRAARVRYKGREVELRRGQLAVSVRDFAGAMDRDKGWVERLLKRLRDRTMIETRAETGVLVISICNYDKYQASDEGGETVSKTPRRTAARQEQDTEQGREEGKKDKTPLTPQRGEAEEIVDHWNEMAKRAGLSEIRALTRDRQRSLKARLREHGKELLLEAIAAVEKSPHCCGENDRAWRATFDFVLQPKSFAKLLEGAYGVGRTGSAQLQVPIPAKPVEQVTGERERAAVIGELRKGEGERAFRMRTLLRNVMGALLYNQWLDGCALTLEGEDLVVLFHAEFARDFVEKHHRERIRAAAEEVLERRADVLFRLAPASCDETHAGRLAA